MASAPVACPSRITTDEARSALSRDLALPAPERAERIVVKLFVDAIARATLTDRSARPRLRALDHAGPRGPLGGARLRAVYGAAHPHGGGLSTLEHDADLYFDLGRVPYELVGGVEGKGVQERFDHWFEKVYPRVRAQAPAPENPG